MPDPRVPLDADTLAALLADVPGPGGVPWRCRVVPTVGSTNADVAASARAGAPAGEVLVAEEQVAGRGRLGRTWTAPPRSALTFSTLLRPDVPPARWAWLPLLTGVAVTDALVATTGTDARLKWPNDLLAHVDDTDRKLGGILVERADTAAVVGLGLNVTLTPDEIPVPTATSLLLAGATVPDRAPLLAALLRSLATWHDRWTEAGGDPDRSGLRDAYTARCATLGRDVRVLLPDGTETPGHAVDVDPTGRLVLDTPDGPRAVSAGDVRHVR